MFDAIGSFLELFNYAFVRNALIAGLLIAVCASVIGVFLVLRGQALITDGLSHVSFASIAIALVIGQAPVLVSLPIVILASFLINKLSGKAGLYSDASIGLVASVSMAIGITVISLAGGISVDINSYLFGSILSVRTEEVWLAVGVTVIVFAALIFFFNDLFTFVFDEDFAAVMGIRKKRVDLVFSILQSVVIVVGVKIVGSLLMSSLVIFPAISALRIVKRFKNLMAVSALFALISVLGGILLSFFLNLPTGAGIVLINAFLFIIAFGIGKILR